MYLSNHIQKGMSDDLTFSTRSEHCFMGLFFLCQSFFPSVYFHAQIVKLCFGQTKVFELYKIQEQSQACCILYFCWWCQLWVMHVISQTVCRTSKAHHCQPWLQKVQYLSNTAHIHCSAFPQHVSTAVSWQIFLKFVHQVIWKTGSKRKDPFIIANKIWNTFIHSWVMGKSDTDWTITESLPPVTVNYPESVVLESSVKPSLGLLALYPSDISWTNWHSSFFVRA